MSSENLSSDILMLRGIGLTSKARGMVRTSKKEALRLLHEGVSLMFSSLDKEPDSVANNTIALRHLVGITVESPVKYYYEIDKIIGFFNENMYRLSSEEKALYFAAAGEYYLHIGDDKKGLKLLGNVSKEQPDSSVSKIAELSIAHSLSKNN